MIYGELGITPLNLSIGNRILNFWARIVNGKPDQISVILYKLAYERHKRNIYQSPWITYVVLLFYVHGKHLRSCRDGQLT